jgi:carboxyl-terminal processing protease
MTRTALFLALTSCSALAEHPEGSSGTEPAVASLVAGMLASYHYDGRPVDDAIAVEWLDAYLERLDYGRTVFLATDVEEFRALAPTIDDDIRTSTPSLSVAHTIHARYQQRLKERLAAARAVLAGPIDLTNPESYVFDRTDAPWPANAKAADDLWRQRIEEELILGALRKKPDEETRALLAKRYHRLEADALSAEPMDVVEHWLTALTTVYDPHSTYFKPASHDSFDIEMANSLEGIGASLQTEGEYTVVKELIAGGPAEKGGILQKEDKIIAVAQGEGEPVDVVDLRIDKVVKLIRGKKGTEVRLTVIPAGAVDSGQTKVVSITRDKVVLADSDAELKIHEVGGKRVAVIEVPSFYLDVRGKRSATSDLERILTQEMGKVDAVVLDLRKNGGGSLPEAVSMTGLFIPRGPVVQIRERDGTVESLDDRDPKVAWSGPLMVLTSPVSASASEIVAGAIQDYGRGLVVGSKTTHGKGTVQTVIDLSDMMTRMFRGTGPEAGALKLTTQKFYRVTGSSTQVKGVQADVVIPSVWDGLDVYEGDLDHVLPWDEIGGVDRTVWAEPLPAVSTLQAASDARVAASEAFREMAEARIERDKMRDQKSVALVLSERLAEHAASPRAEEPDPEAKDTTRPDHELDEALAVMVDWLALG